MTTRTRLEGAADLLRQGRFAEARSKLLKELRLAPKNPVALQLLGAVTFEMGRHEEAIEHLRGAVHLAPSSPGPGLNLGKALLEARRLDEAAAVLENAARQWPDIAEAHLFYGNVLLAKAEQAHAAEQYRAAIRLAPALVDAHTNLALALQDLNDYEALVQVCERLLDLDPSSTVGQFLLARSHLMLCAWDDGYEARIAKLAELVARGSIVPSMAFISFLLWDDAGLHKRCAELATGFYAAGAVSRPAKLSVRTSGRVRLAYVSADFRQHPMSRCIASVIEGHDRNRFEVIAISLGKDDGSAARQRMTKAFDQFLDLRGSETDAIAQTMRDLNIDIAIDLMGHTLDSRPQLFLQRVAPLQVNYLGFAGTSGIGAMDYIIVDPFVAAGGLRQACTEKLVIMPDCYFSNDGLQRPPAVPPSRASYDLPEDAFVFCSFNGTKKLTPQVFDQWMRILRQVEGSVLWLLKPSDQAVANLRREAAHRGVDPARIVFAGRVDNDVHIARNGVPDLHLDTFPCTAHTTASDALRAGAPILTRAGASFPARVCGSLLTTIGVPELIVHSPEEYEAMAVRLAGDKALLSGFRRRIEQGRGSSPLFDPARFCRNMELAYTAMVERSRAGQPPSEIDVRTLAGAPALG